jgi:hypothetical protein
MADDLPPGYTLDAPAAGGGGDLPPGYKLDEPPVSREREIQAEVLKKLNVKKPGYEDRFVDQYTLGIPGPLKGLTTMIEGKANEWFGDGKPATAGEYYRGGYNAQRDYFDQAVKNTPGPAGTAVDIAGAVGSGLGTSSKILGKGTQAIGAGIQGAIGGASRNADDWGKAAKGGAVGGTVDAGASWMLGGLLDRFTRGAKKDIGIASRGGNAQTLEREGSELFTKLDNAGIHFSGTETPALANKVNAVTSGPLPASVRGEINETVQDLNRRVQNGAMTYGDVRAIQTEISKLRANPNPDVRRVAGDMANAVDDFFHSAKPTMPSSSVGTVSPGDLDAAKSLWARASKASQVEHAAQKGTGTAIDETAATRKVAKNFETIVDKARSGKGYSPYANNAEQMRLMDKIVESGPTASKAEALNRKANIGLATGATAAGGMALSPMLGLDTGTTGSHLGWTGTALTLAAALGAKGRGSQLASAASRGSTEGVNDLMRHIVTGSVDKTGAYVPRDALAKILAAQDLARGGGNYVSSYVRE